MEALENRNGGPAGVRLDRFFALAQLASNITCKKACNYF